MDWVRRTTIYRASSPSVHRSTTAGPRTTGRRSCRRRSRGRGSATAALRSQRRAWRIPLRPTVRNSRDAHSGLRNNHATMARRVDKPIAALLTDLKQRGLLEDTLVVFGTEFGRTPAAQGTDGRDHHPHAFSMWLAGGGIKGGMVYGTTDEFGYYVAEKKVTIPDLHATILHLLGLDHTRLTFRHAGRDYRLTDVAGNVVKEIIA